AAAAAAAHAGAVTVETGAESEGILSKARLIIVGAGATAATIAQTVATGAATAAQALFNVVMSANPIAIVVIAIVALVAILAVLYNKNETVRNAINALWGGLQSLGGYIMGGLMAAWNGLTTALFPITHALGNLWNAISKVFSAFAASKSSQASSTFTQIASAASWLWGILSQVASFVVSALTPVFNVLATILIAVANVILSGLGAALTTISGIIISVVNFIANFINAIAACISGTLTFGQMMDFIWGSFGDMVSGILSAIMNGIGAFAISLVSKGVSAALGFVNGVILWITQLPGKIWIYLSSSLTKIVLFANQSRAKAVALAKNIVSSVATGISSLPGKMWTYLSQGISKIATFASNGASRAKSAAIGIGNSIISGISSIPGKMASWGSNIITSFINGIKARITDLLSLLSYIKSFFPSSPPKAGPLSKIKAENMAWFGGTLGDALTSGLSDSTQDLFSDITDLSGSANVDLTSSSKFVSGSNSSSNSSSNSESEKTVNLNFNFTDAQNIDTDKVISVVTSKKVVNMLNVEFGKVAKQTKRSAGG
ncbi:MAG: hypothetical protein K8E24_012570, partial [Methanobacterium paludis]|nr:hypothetical protein [Methanobacterium paludis]